MNMEEIWKDIKEYDGKYQVSNLGRVKSLKDTHGRYREKLLKQGKNNSGYPMVNLYKNSKYTRVRIHRLVAETFIPNPNNYPCVNHKDENPSNNNVDNLEWCDYKYNSNYGTCIQRRVANTDYKAIAAKIDWKKKVANTDYKAIAAKIDYKKKVENTNYKLIAEKQSKRVLQFTKDNEFVKEWVSTAECGRNGFNQGHVASCCRGELKYHKGFIWRYKND